MIMLSSCFELMSWNTFAMLKLDIGIEFIYQQGLIEAGWG